MIWFALVLAAAATQNPNALDRTLDGKNYPFCLGFTDPFPADKISFGRATISAQARLVGGSSSKLLARGAMVMVSNTRGGYASVFDPAGSGAEGCVASSRLVRDTSPFKSSAWLGRWRKIGDPPKLADEILIKAVGKKLSVSGNAYWGVPGYDPNFGSVDGAAVPVRNTLVISDPDEPDCAVTLTTLDGYLIASQPRADQNCSEMGGNVTFSGVYRRVKR